ncbi:histidinol-phosphatase HisJ [Salipaludibacillus keqinensis]|uniref:histidinol-phosphatase HisJ n=1 Tax=Salipaludibacillus keqinensis TaxID=2045207 RepID=UPI0018EE97FF|nr:histidinol-phosphatase HisJ [Salipaludibacillus keqinensis]
MITHDKHIHTQFCPHGSKDSMFQYVERALELGMSSISFTEHAPLPEGFTDPVPQLDSAMSKEILPQYIEKCQQIKERFIGQIEINIGLEVDYVAGYEKETRNFLNTWGPELDDSILSVHFLKPVGGAYVCLDYDANAFQDLVRQCGSLKKVYELYFATLHSAISSDLGSFTPNRIGHISLVRKFQKLFPREFDDSSMLNETLQLLKKHDKAMDVNVAGLVKEFCKEIYPPVPWIEKAKNMNIPLYYGSDAHSAKQLGQNRHMVETLL